MPHKYPKYDEQIDKLSEEAGLDPELVRAVIWQESGGNPTRVSKKGAIGLMQIMPDTGARFGVQPEDLKDPQINLAVGISHLADMYRRYQGDIEKTLAAYNSGAKNVDAANGVPNIDETKDYVKRITADYGNKKAPTTVHKSEGKQQTISEFADSLRNKYDLSGDTRSDAQLVVAYLKKNPDQIGQVKLVQSKPGKTKPQVKPPEEPGLLPPMEDWRAAAGVPTQEEANKMAEKYHSQPWYQHLGQAALESTGLPTLAGIGKSMYHEGKRAVTAPLGPMTAVHGLSALNPLAAPIVDPVTTALEHGKPGQAVAGAVEGVATLGLGGLGGDEAGAVKARAGAFDEMSNIGEGLEVSKSSMDAARAETRIQEDHLSREIDTMRDQLKGEWVDVKTLRNDIAKAVKEIRKIEKSPQMMTRDISAAKDIVARIADRSKKGMMPWPEAQALVKELRNAELKTKGASALRDNLHTIKDAVDAAVEKSANKTPYGKAYKAWRTNERGLHNLQRAHAKINDRTTPAQLKAGSTKGPGVPVPRTGIRIGGRSVSRAGKKQFKTWDKALEHFNTKLGLPKGARGPRPGTPPPSTPPTMQQQPPPGPQPGGPPPGQPPGGAPPPGGPPPPPAAPPQPPPGGPPPPPGGGPPPPPAAPPAAPPAGPPPPPGGAAPPQPGPPITPPPMRPNAPPGGGVKPPMAGPGTFAQRTAAAQAAKQTQAVPTTKPVESPASGLDLVRQREADLAAKRAEFRSRTAAKEQSAQKAAQEQAERQADLEAAAARMKRAMDETPGAAGKQFYELDKKTMDKVLERSEKIKEIEDKMKELGKRLNKL